MPGEEGFISAMTAPVVNLAIAAVVVALIAVVLMTLLYVITSRQASNNLKAALDNSNKLLGALVTQGNQQAAQGAQISRHGERLESMIRVLENGQDIQKDQLAQTKRIGDAIDRHEETSAGYVDSIQARADERQKALADHIKHTTAQSMTDLIGATEGIVSKSTQHIVDTLLEGLGTIRTSIETVQAEYRAKMEAIGDQVAETQHKFIQAIKIDLRGEREQKSAVDGGGTPVPLVSVGAASGSAGGDSSGGSGGARGGNNGTTA